MRKSTACCSDPCGRRGNSRNLHTYGYGWKNRRRLGAKSCLPRGSAPAAAVSATRFRRACFGSFAARPDCTRRPRLVLGRRRRSISDSSPRRKKTMPVTVFDEHFYVTHVLGNGDSSGILPELGALLNETAGALLADLSRVDLHIGSTPLVASTQTSPNLRSHCPSRAIWRARPRTHQRQCSG